MKYLSLFSGYGGLDLAIQEIGDPIAYVEIEEYAQKIIAYRMADGSLKPAPILADVKNIRGSVGVCDLIVGGFPCQDISVAGNGKGLAGKRSGLFYEVVRLTKEIRPSFVFIENVPAIRTRGLDQVIKEFTEIGYDCRWCNISAESIGAPHKRERFFLMAHSKYNGLYASKVLASTRKTIHSVTKGEKEACEFEGGNTPSVLSTNKTIRLQETWTVEPNVGRVANGAAFRVDRIKAIGNGVVPAQARKAFYKLLGIETAKGT